jgi:predicted regulator of Ras-like GTPase activity (Roadblock/LC7/MglB family)
LALAIPGRTIPGVLCKPPCKARLALVFIIKWDLSMSKLDDLLKEMSTEVTGYIACTLVGRDGMNVASYVVPKSMDPDAIGAQMTTLFNLVDDSAQKLGVGEVDDNLITTEYAYILLRYLPGKSYHLVLLTYRKAGNLGNMRLVCKNFTDRISRALPA